MKPRLPFDLLAAFLVCGLHTARMFADDPVTLENLSDPGPNKIDEPIAAAWSADKALHFLDSAALSWQKKRKCFTCHTNYAFLYARPLVDADNEAHRQVRKFAEELVTVRWKEKGPRSDAEIVATAAALAFNDSKTSNKLHETTKTALDRMWTVQRRNGSFKWLHCDWPPFESDDHYGVTLAALAVGYAPEEYAKSAAAKKGLKRIRKYLRTNRRDELHYRMMQLWASVRVRGILKEAQRKQIVQDIFAAQKADGGWNLPTLGPSWLRFDESEQDTNTSDCYATGFAIYVLRQAEIPADDLRIQRGIAWLKANQRESGRWFTRSLFKDSLHFISHAGSAFAVMALAECGEFRNRNE